MREYIEISKEKKEKLEQFIRGSLLGDGCIPKKSLKNINFRMAFTHCTEQLEYLKWKKSLLDEYELGGVVGKYLRVAERFIAGFYIQYVLKSKTHPIFSIFRDLYYPEGKKLICKEDLVKLDEFGLAIWYMDDGSIWNRKARSSCLVLYTNGFTKEDVHFLMKFLLNKWGIKSTYYKCENSIRISSLDTPKFIEIVSPHIVDCLKYKTQLIKQNKK